MSTHDEQPQDPNENPQPSEIAENPEEEAAPTPFDHPLFLPILLSGLTLWFGYDGWINQDPDMLEHVTFNRVGFGVLLCGAIYYGVQGFREWKEMNDQDD